jgi:hypothetical protein
MEHPEGANGNGTVLPDGGHTTNTSASKLQTDCKKQHMNSLQCIQDNYETKDVACQKYFDLYKECRKNEHAAILERNRQSASSRSSGSFW